MSDTPYIDELLGHAKALVTLLEDPHPGLMTWRVALHQLLQKMSRFKSADLDVEAVLDILLADIDYEQDRLRLTAEKVVKVLEV